VGLFWLECQIIPLKDYDMHKAVKNRSFFKYYLFDDPTHVNKLSIRKVSKDLSEFFKEVYLEPSYGFLGTTINKIVGEIDHRSPISVFSDKYFGYAIK